MVRIDASRYMKLLFVLLFSMLLYSCYSPEDGCLDPESTNYSIDGDFQCEDCCVYPILKLSIFHESRDTTFTLKDVVRNDLGQQVSLIDFVCLLSDFKITSSGNIFEIQDSVSLPIDDLPLMAKDDVIRVSRSDFTYDVGTIVYTGSTDELAFRIGLSEELNENGATIENEDHPLTNDMDSLYIEESGTYVFQRIKLAQGNNFIDTVIYDVTIPVDVSFGVEYESVRGKNKELIIEAQYDHWFDGIDFNLMSPDEIGEKIGENSVNVFRFKED